MPDLSKRLYEEGVPQRFVLQRDEDFTGISGTGVVAWGVMFPNGRCVTAWNSEVSQTCVWASLNDLLAVHGHEGRTRLEWLDAPWPVENPHTHSERGAT